MNSVNDNMSLEELYKDINTHLITDSIPSIYLSSIIDSPNFQKPPFQFLYQLKLTEQSPIHHPEGNVWNHTLLVTDEAAKRKNLSKNPTVFMWAALLHDIGKPPTTKIRHGRITSYDHDKVGTKMARDFLSYFTEDKSFIEDVCTLIEFHMHILYVVKKLPYGNIPDMLKRVDINELALFGLCDRLGRTNASIEDAESTIQEFIKLCNQLKGESNNGKSRNETTRSKRTSRNRK